MSWPLTGLVASKVIGSPVKRLVLLTMASRANDDGTGIYASFQTMARDCELSRATVKRTIKELEGDGLIKQVGTRPCSNGKTNDYSISVRRISALPDIKKDRGQSEPGSERTGSKDVNPVQSEPGSASEPGSERPVTRVSLTPKPIQNLPIPAPLLGARPVHDRDLWNARLDEAKARAGKWLRGTNPVAHTYLGLRNLCEPAAGEPCDWEADVLPAIDLVAARGKYFDTWDYIGRIAIENRDKRLAGLPDPQPQSQQRAAGGRAPRASYSDTIQRVAKEMGIE